MDWVVLKNANRDAEREHLNKILKEIQTSISGRSSSSVGLIGPQGLRGSQGPQGDTGPQGPSAFNRIDSDGDIRCDASFDLRITVD